MQHELKSSIGYLDRIRSGAKTLELRKGDRIFSVGDTLHLREFDQRSYKYTGRSLQVCVTDIVTSSDGPWLAEGYVAMSIRLSDLVGTLKSTCGELDELCSHAHVMERTPDGHINNCALANGEAEKDCQVCCGKCPDKKEFEAS